MSKWKLCGRPVEWTVLENTSNGSLKRYVTAIERESDGSWSVSRFWGRMDADRPQGTKRTSFPSHGAASEHHSEIVDSKLRRSYDWGEKECVQWQESSQDRLRGAAVSSDWLTGFDWRSVDRVL